MNNSLKKLRKGKGLSLKALSERTGIALSTIGNFEVGRRNMREEYLKKIAEALGVSANEILASDSLSLAEAQDEACERKMLRLLSYGTVDSLRGMLQAAIDNNDFDSVSTIAAELRRQKNELSEQKILKVAETGMEYEVGKKHEKREGE